MKLREIISESKATSTKPRNPVMAGSKPGRGTVKHKDQKKAQKQGEVKHKKKEYATESNFSKQSSLMKNGDIVFGGDSAGKEKVKQQIKNIFNIDEPTAEESVRTLIDTLSKRPLTRTTKTVLSNIMQMIKKYKIGIGGDYYRWLDKVVETKNTDDTQARSLSETATAGATTAANVSVGAIYKNKKPKMQKPGTNALDGDNLLTGGSIVKRK